VSRRGRAAAFALLALAAAAFAAAIADRYGSRAALGFGRLVPVVVARGQLPAGEAIGPDAIESKLELRRVPERFVPPGTLLRPETALGLEPIVVVPPGSYLASHLLRPPRERSGRRRSRLARGLRPVQLTIAGSAPAIGAVAPPGRATVDVVVTAEPAGAGAGRTYVAAAGVPLLSLAPGQPAVGPAATAEATLALTRAEALDLIAAESFARRMTLLPRARR
jgi:Flp pilus assembly protein CpaB